MCQLENEDPVVAVIAQEQDTVPVRVSIIVSAGRPMALCEPVRVHGAVPDSRERWRTQKLSNSFFQGLGSRQPWSCPLEHEDLLDARRETEA